MAARGEDISMAVGALGASCRATWCAVTSVCGSSTSSRYGGRYRDSSSSWAGDKHTIKTRKLIPIFLRCSLYAIAAALRWRWCCRVEVYRLVSGMREE